MVRLRQAEPSAHIWVDMYTVFVVTKALEIFLALAAERVNTFETLLFMRLRLSDRFCSRFVRVTAVD